MCSGVASSNVTESFVGRYEECSFGYYVWPQFGVFQAAPTLSSDR